MKKRSKGEKRPKYFVLKEYSDGRQLIMSPRDWRYPHDTDEREAGWFEEKSLLNCGGQIKWSIPTKEQWMVLVRLLEKKKINFDDLHFLPNAGYAASWPCDNRNSHTPSFLSRSRCLFYSYGESGLDYEADDTWAIRPMAIIRPEYLRPTFPNNLKLYVHRHGALDFEMIKRPFLRLMEELERLHRKDLCHNDICPDNITVEKKEDGMLMLTLQPSPFTAPPCRGTARLNWEVPHEFFFAPENYIGETSAQSDQYQLAKTLYYCLKGGVPSNAAYAKPVTPYLYSLQKSYIKYGWDKDREVAKSYWGHSLVKALRPNPAERFASINEWRMCLLFKSVDFEVNSTFEETDKHSMHFELVHEGWRHYKICSFFSFPFGNEIPFFDKVVEAYQRLGIRLSKHWGYSEYWLQEKEYTHQYLCWALSGPRQLFRLMMDSVAWEKKEYHDLHINHVINTVNQVSQHVRIFNHYECVFMIYETPMDENSDFEMLIMEAHEELQDTETLFARLLDGGQLSREELLQSTRTFKVPVFDVTPHNEKCLFNILQRVNSALYGAWSVIRDEHVYIEGNGAMANAVEKFEYIKNFAYQLWH